MTPSWGARRCCGRLEPDLTGTPPDFLTWRRRGLDGDRPPLDDHGLRRPSGSGRDRTADGFAALFSALIIHPAPTARRRPRCSTGRRRQNQARFLCHQRQAMKVIEPGLEY